MNASNHRRPRWVKLILALGGIASVLAVAELARLAADARGVYAGLAVLVAAYLVCWCAAQLRTVRQQMARRPAPVRLPEPATDREPASSLS